MSGIIEPGEAKRQLAESSPLFSSFWQAQEAEWEEDGGIPSTVLFGDFAFEVSKEIDRLAPVELTSLFATLEYLLVHGNQQVGEIIATGFLEALLAAVGNGELDIEKVKPYLGPESVEYCVAWDLKTFSGNAGPADRQSG